MAGLAGKWGRFQIGSTTFKITDVDLESSVEWNETTNCESGPSASTGNVQAERVPNIGDGRVEMTVVYRPQDGVYASLTPGTSYAVTYYPDKTLTGDTFTGILSVEKFTFQGRIHDAFKARITGMFNSITGVGMVAAGL